VSALAITKAALTQSTLAGSAVGAVENKHDNGVRIVRYAEQVVDGEHDFEPTHTAGVTHRHAPAYPQSHLVHGGALWEGRLRVHDVGLYHRVVFAACCAPQENSCLTKVSDGTRSAQGGQNVMTYGLAASP
jgi:hypothetical protein